jgi:hypothetical protein
LFASVAPPGSANIPFTIGVLAFGITLIAAIAAMSARETYRFEIKDLGKPDAIPVNKDDYNRRRAQAIAEAGR